MILKILKKIVKKREKKSKKKLKKRIRRFCRQVLGLVFLAGTGYLTFVHRNVIIAAIKGEPLPQPKHKHCFNLKKKA